MTTRTLTRIAAAIDDFSDRTGRLIAWLTLAMVLVTIAVVALRRLSIGYIWMQESVTWMHAVVFMLAAAYTLKHDEHVRVDVFYREMSRRRKAVVDLAGTLLLLLPMCAFVFFASLDYVTQSWQIREASREAGGLPGIFLLKTAIPLMSVLLAAQGLADVGRALVVLGGGADEAKSPSERHGL